MSSKREQLEQEAVDAVQRSGLHSISFRTLADRVGIKSSSVHYYFPEKESLAGRLIENYTRDLEQELARISSATGSLRKRLEGFIRIFEDVQRDQKMCLCGMMAAEVENLGTGNRDLLQAYFQLAENWLHELLREHREALDSTQTPRNLARVITSGLEGALLLDRVSGGNDRMKAQRQAILGLVR